MQLFKYVALAIALGSAPLIAKTDVTDFADAAKLAVEQAKEKGWLKGFENTKLDPKQIERVTDIAKQAQVIAIQNTSNLSNDNQQKQPDLMEQTNGALFISLSMPRKALLDSFKVAHENNLVIVFRGLKKQTNHISIMMKEIHKLSAVAKVEPKVGIDPTKFAKYNITAVPTIVIDKGESFISVPGTLDFEFVKNEFKDKEGEQVAVGPLFNIEEVDLIEKMKQAAANIDWETKKKQAVKRFWKNYKTFELPQANEERQWLIDPTVRVVKDIKNGKGEILARAGDVLNPLTQFPMSLRIFVINPSIAKEIDWLKNELKKVSGMFQVHITHVDKSNGWENLNEIRSALGTPVFLLQEQVLKKFDITATPSVVQTRPDGLIQVEQVNAL